MPIIETIGKSKNKHKGSFSMKTLYTMVYDILIAMGYTVKETQYKLKEGESKFLDINWEATKKVDDFTMFSLAIRFFLTSWKPKQKIQKDGAMITTDIGDPEFTIKFKLTRDYDGKWERNPFLKLFLNFYIKYIYRKTYRYWKDKITEEVGEVNREVKNYFDMA